MEAWLRSEPEHLAFTEVWRDLLQVLERKMEFKTLAGKENKFQATASEESQGILIETDSKNIVFDALDLLDFWQQLRSYGFTSRQIAPSGLSRSSYYLMPIFAELDYVVAASISESYERLRNGSKTIGLQYVPQRQADPMSLFHPARSLTL